MRRALSLALILTAALALTACGKEKHDEVFGERVHAYLMAHPEVLMEMSQKLQDKANKDAAAEQDKALAQGKKALAKPEVRAALEHDGRDFVANPNGKITVSEFYDYRCPHCVNMAPTVLSMVQENPDVRFVFKEMPIFGDTSDRAALAAIAIRKKGGDYVGAYRTFMSTRNLDEATVETALRANGIDPGGIDNAEAQRQITDIKRLAVQLGVAGTPTFIIGDTIIPGEGEAALRAAIAKARGQ